MAAQSLAAMDEADVILFMVDARAGLNIADEAIAQHLRELDKPTFLVANKCDGIDADSACGEFYALALGQVHQIAAAHGRGLQQLLNGALPDYFVPEEEASEADASAGEVAEEMAVLTEAQADEAAERYADLPVKLAIIGKPNVGKSTLTNRILGEERVVVYDMPGTTRDSVYIPMQRDEKRLCSH